MPTRSPRTGHRRSEILAAALTCFSELGIEATTIEMIRSRSGASVGSLYHHFRDKSGIAAALAIEGVTRYQQGLLDILAGDAAPAAAVEAMVRHHVSWVRAHPDWARYLFTQFRSAGGGATVEVELANRRLFDALVEWIDEHAATGRLAPLPAGIFLAVVLGPSQELSRRWLARHEEFDLAALTDHLVGAAQRAVGADT